MRDQVEIGPVPADEDCEQLGPSYDPNKARAECRAFIGQLKRVFGEPPDGAFFRVTSNPHDFGTYYEVAVRYDDNIPASVDYAFKVEGDSPATWDTEARQELGL